MTIQINQFNKVTLLNVKCVVAKVAFDVLVHKNLELFLIKLKPKLWIYKNIFSQCFTSNTKICLVMQRINSFDPSMLMDSNICSLSNLCFQKFNFTVSSSLMSLSLCVCEHFSFQRLNLKINSENLVGVNIFFLARVTSCASS